MELKSAEADADFKQEENSKLLEQTKSLRAELHEARLKLTKLHQLDTAQEETKRLKQQLDKMQEEYEELLEELKSSQQSTASFQQQVRDSQRQLEDATERVEELEKERNGLRLQLETLSSQADRRKTEHVQEVSAT